MDSCRGENKPNKEVKSWSPSKPSYSDFVVVSFLDDVHLSFIQTEPFSFLQVCKKGKRKNSTIKRSSQQYAQTKTKQKNTNTNTKVKKKRKMRLPYSITLHQASNIYKREVREVSESRCPRSADYIYVYIYIYSLQAKSTYKL